MCIWQSKSYATNVFYQTNQIIVWTSQERRNWRFIESHLKGFSGDHTHRSDSPITQLGNGHILPWVDWPCRSHMTYMINGQSDDLYFFFLFQLGMRKSLLYVVNGILLATMFLFCRILIYPYMYWCYSKYANISLLETPFKVPLFCNTFCFFLLSVQVYWFLIIMRGVLRFLQRPTDMPQAPISKVNGENGFLHKNHSTAAGYNANEKIK